MATFSNVRQLYIITHSISQEQYTFIWPKKGLYILGTCIALLVASLGNALAGGYAIPHQTAKAVGLSNAVTAGVNDPSAVYVNPAALTEIEGNQVLGGKLTLIL